MLYLQKVKSSDYSAQDIAPGDIVLGCVESICQRTAAFAQKLAPANPKVFFSGGLAQFDVIKRSLASHLGVKEVATDPLCQSRSN